MGDRTAEDWTVSEMKMPKIRSVNGRGLVLLVAKVGPSWIETADGRRLGVSKLAAWTEEVSGLPLFPCHVEFGIFRGRAYAEFLD